MEERMVDVLGFEGYYKISESGRLYKIRPNNNCEFDIIKEIIPRMNKKGAYMICLSRNGVAKYTHYKSVFHDSFFPERQGMKCKFDGEFHLNNIILLDRIRWTKEDVKEALVQKLLTQNPNMHISEMSRVAQVCEERIRQLKRKLKK